MFVWPDGTVTGSVNVAELEAIQNGMKGVSKKRLASFGPIESAAHLADLLAGNTEETEPEPTTATDTTSEPDTAQEETVPDEKPAKASAATKKGSH